MRLVISPRAARRLREIQAHIALKANLQIALRVVLRIRQSAEMLTDFPRARSWTSVSACHCTGARPVRMGHPISLFWHDRSHIPFGCTFLDIHKDRTYYPPNNTPQATGRKAELNTGGLLICRDLLSTLKFTKKPSSIEQQLQLLIQRGMDVGDHDTAMKWLETVGYYRLSAYWLPFERPPENGNARSKIFESGATLSAVTDLYVFDRRLRVLVLEAIERVEVHVRSRWTYHMAHAHGAHAHLDHRLFSGL